MSIFSRKKRSHGELDAEYAKLTAEKSEAEARRLDLISARRDVELYAELSDLEKHDAEIARQKLTIDRAKSRLEQINAERLALEAEGEQARRLGVYGDAERAQSQGRDALKLYQKHAALAADALRAYGDAKSKIDDANAQLPDGKSEIVDPEPSNALPMTLDANGWPSRSAIAHQTVLDRAIIPTLERAKYFYGAKNVVVNYQRGGVILPSDI